MEPFLIWSLELIINKTRIGNLRSVGMHVACLGVLWTGVGSFAFARVQEMTGTAVADEKIAYIERHKVEYTVSRSNTNMVMRRRAMRCKFLSMGLAFLLIGETAMATNLQKAKDTFDNLNKDNMNLVEDFYDQDAVFQDPVHKIKGTKAIREYYTGLYKNVDAIRFEYRNASESGNFVTLEWRMHLKTPSLNSGKELTVDGVSLITFGGKEGKVIAHRDYFDMGEFVYERVPVLSSIVGFIKKKMKGT
jgi:ketosteroid isomerase-like protein